MNKKKKKQKKEKRMKKTSKTPTDASAAYRNLNTGLSKATFKEKDAPRATKTVSSGDLRAPKGGK